MTQLIYLADDEKNIRDLLTPFLEHDGFLVKAFENGDLLYQEFLIKKPDLIILDIMMPGTDGLEVMKLIRSYDQHLPIIMLTARDSDADFITAFNLGTDDYFTKPFSPIKLSLHVKSLLKRSHDFGSDKKSAFTYRELTLDSEKRLATLFEHEIPLTKTEFDLLLVLIEKPETAFSREELLNRIWGFEDIESRAVDDTVKRLRKKLNQYHSKVALETIWGYGFKLGEKES
ncbi:response regulator transcription factor [Streptococcus porcinus]|uniref:Transcriptional regulatory protein DltR n=2 Tax=Streptococcus porcinus TaxID=1340 RepID=A0A4V6LY86_STRPO|nr:response regulator transcription factor [Streptococcus porcinus]EGJ26541.1 putative transcriptional regulatory protein ResD [Streptococcus porcinus str. Jelinkova 176]SQG42600.1 response regulator protein [Streptococcus porcinus]VTT41629.1 response regulator protein [Streptococcus porcinus]VTT42666.1 response regulator protein [Streptococcus porcinus]